MEMSVSHERKCDMPLLKINDVVSINTDQVESVESLDQLNCTIYMYSGRVHIANFPFDTLLTLLQSDTDSDDSIDTKKVLSNLEKRLNVLSKSATFFAG